MNIVMKKRILILSILYGGLGIFLLTTNPNSLPIWLVITPVLWLFVTLVYSFFSLISMFSPRSPRPRKVWLSFMLALLPTMLLLLKSINQLSPKDILLLLVLSVLGLFYSSRLRAAR